jgi:hypothetical protein
MELILYSVLAVAFIWFCVFAARLQRDEAPPHSYGSNVVHNFFRLAFVLLLLIGVGWFIWWSGLGEALSDDTLWWQR